MSERAREGGSEGGREGEANLRSLNQGVRSCVIKGIAFRRLWEGIVWTLRLQCRLPSRRMCIWCSCLEVSCWGNILPRSLDKFQMHHHATPLVASQAWTQAPSFQHWRLLPRSAKSATNIASRVVFQFSRYSFGSGPLDHFNMFQQCGTVFQISPCLFKGQDPT